MKDSCKADSTPKGAVQRLRVYKKTTPKTRHNERYPHWFSLQRLRHKQIYAYCRLWR